MRDLVILLVLFAPLLSIMLVLFSGWPTRQTSIGAAITVLTAFVCGIWWFGFASPMFALNTAIDYCNDQTSGRYVRRDHPLCLEAEARAVPFAALRQWFEG